MGWTWMRREGRAVKEVLVDAMRPYKVLDIAIVDRTTAYIAFETPKGGVAAAVFLLGYAVKARYDFGYKDMDETMGPVESDCPERILKLLTAEPIGYAKEWRERCWQRIHNKQRVLSGAIFRTAEPIKFSDGVRRQRFKHYKASKYISLDDQVLVTMRKRVLQNILFE